ncbi:Putative Phosphoribosyltransferase domain, adenine phosphoribosyl transferase [Septoria linicola]|uniref:adenine phosphoribosyltransferase n=1 Tax=Septoria linicola TaxID=215465 RepID=A0A9Q9AQE1_9PEZI|nr:putative Phosphoribosyltransferase domain, adenine phosphoribosyl transferase [Septoria linicola]USW48911.1 Putative Phosphoribosyltransferase domain, adenine phosphoribosyl transferase [Septoria linicola]
MSGAPPASHVNATHAAQQTPGNTTNNQADVASTSAHPPPSAPDPTAAATTTPKRVKTSHDASERGLPTSSASSSSQLASLKVKLKNGLRQFPDFPSPGILFEDIMPLFSNPELHQDLITALELQFLETFGKDHGIDVIVGLESRGFLFGPTLALRLGAGFVPVRKQGKLPGECVTEGYEKEYGTDFFQMQGDAVKKGAKVVIVDDIIATGGSAAAAGNLVSNLGGDLLGFVFLMELDFLKGREKLNAPVHTLFSGQDEALNSSK